MCIIKKHYHYFLFFFISLISLLLQYEAGNFKLIIFHDSPYPIDALSLINKFSSVWRDIANFGYFDPTGPYLTIYYYFVFLIDSLTASNLVFTQFLFLFIICNVTLISTYYLARHIGISKIFSILCGILYLANPYSIFYVWRILNANMLLYAALPLIFLSILKIVRTEKNYWKYIFVLLFGELLSSPGFANTAFYVSFVFVTLVLSLSYSLILISSPTHFRIRNIILKNLIVLILLSLPIAGYLFSTLEVQPTNLKLVWGTAKDLSLHMQTYNFTAEHRSLASLFSLTGLAPLYEKQIWFNFEYIYLSSIANVDGIIVASVIFIVLSVRATYKSGINKNIYPFIIILVLLGILLLRETGFPIFQKFPILFLLFRESFMKLGFGYTLSLIILFSYCSQEILNMTRIYKQYKFPKVALILIIIFPAAFWTFPFISGNFIPTDVRWGDNLHAFSAFTDLPYKYMPAINYLKQDKDIVNGKVRVLVYPSMPNPIWGLCNGNGYWGNDILRFSGISTISNNVHRNFENETNFLNRLYNIRFLDNLNYLNILSRLGIKYILIQKQPCGEGILLVNNLPNITKSEEEKVDNGWSELSKNIEEKMNKMPVKKVMENTYYSLFEIAGKDFGTVSLVKESSIDLITNKETSFLNTTYNSNKFLKQSIQPQYQKTSSTEYTINIENITKPFYIMFAVSYDEGWKAFINGKEQIPDKYHFIVSDFANGWYVNKSGNFNVKLYFQPQRYYEISLTLYTLTFACSMFYLFYRQKENLRDFVSWFFREEH